MVSPHLNTFFGKSVQSFTKGGKVRVPGIACINEQQGWKEVSLIAELVQYIGVRGYHTRLIHV